MQLVKHLKWRYATKRYDSSKKVSEHHINYIKEAVQLTASSYGLQPFKVLEIKDPKLREELRQSSWNQSQITDASNLFVFCNYTKVSNEDIDKMMLLKAKTNDIPLEKILGYGEFVKEKLEEKSEVELFHWTAKQTYMALSNAISACAELQIDCTPMEGFNVDEYNEKLGLNEMRLNASVLFAVGYRHHEDRAQNNKKVRKPIASIFEEI